ncbi:phasin family protein [Pollutimonas bauzanensis]|uniref:phasin family protein n=1 Tax=Pollutimonas bauzanensis TaxID=658167 RepID=UPI00333F1140
MKTETDTALDAYQQQLVVTREISEAFFEGAGRIENVWLEQTGRILDEQLKFFRAAAAVQDPQGLAALHSAFFSQSPNDLIKAQQQILNVVTDTQTRISKILSNNASLLKAGFPSLGSKAIPLATPESSNTPVSKKESAHAKG